MRSGRATRLRPSDFLILGTAFAAFYAVSRLFGNGSWCLFRTFTGLPCPGCGLTAAARALLRGEVAQSLHYHPLLLLPPAVVVVGLLRRRVNFCRRLHESRGFYPAVIAIFLAVFILRLALFFPDGGHPMNFSRRSVLYRTGVALRLLEP